MIQGSPCLIFLPSGQRAWATKKAHSTSYLLGDRLSVQGNDCPAVCTLYLISYSKAHAHHVLQHVMKCSPVLKTRPRCTLAAHQPGLQLTKCVGPHGHTCRRFQPGRHAKLAATKRSLPLPMHSMKMKIHSHYAQLSTHKLQSHTNGPRCTQQHSSTPSLQTANTAWTCGTSSAALLHLLYTPWLLPQLTAGSCTSAPSSGAAALHLCN